MKKQTPDHIKKVYYCRYCKGVVSEAEEREMEGICDCGEALRHNDSRDVLNHYRVNGLKLLVKLQKAQIKNYELLTRLVDP